MPQTRGGYSAALPPGEKLASADRAFRIGETIQEEEALLSVPDEKVLIETVPQVLLRAGGQLQRLNATLPRLRLDGGCVPLICIVCLLEVRGEAAIWRRATAALQDIAKSADKEEAVRTLTLAHAAKKIIPTEFVGKIDPAELGALLAVWRAAAVPHDFSNTTGGASLFPTISRLQRGSGDSVSCAAECSRSPSGGWRCKISAAVSLEPGNRLVLPSTTYGEAAPQTEGQRDPCGAQPAQPAQPSQPAYSYADFNAQGGIVAPSHEPQKLASKLHLPLSTQTKVEPFMIPGRGDEPGRVAFSIDNVFTREECARLQDLAFRDWDNTLCYRQMLKTGSEDNYRLLRAGSDIHEAIWHRIRKFCPARWRGWKARGLNDRTRFIQYDPGERFVAHTDGEYSINEGPRKGWRSFITIQVYLNGDGLVGGSTRFLQGQDELLYDVQPVAGKVIVFEHTMRHTGEEVIDGMKRIIRTEIMYEPPDEASAAEAGAQEAVNLPHGYLANPPVVGEN